MGSCVSKPKPSENVKLLDMDDLFLSDKLTPLPPELPLEERSLYNVFPKEFYIYYGWNPQISNTVSRFARECLSRIKMKQALFLTEEDFVEFLGTSPTNFKYPSDRFCFGADGKLVYRAVSRMYAKDVMPKIKEALSQTGPKVKNTLQE